MELAAAISLIEKGVAPSDRPQEWADLGSGNGLFTKALLALLPPASFVHAVDQDENALSLLRKQIEGTARTYTLNFELDDLPFSQLDGIMLANALHFVKDQPKLLIRIKSLLKPGAVLILIEYDLSTGNAWVPFPVRFEKMKKICEALGFSRIEKLGEVPSRYNSSNIYSCAIWP